MPTAAPPAGRKRVILFTRGPHMGGAERQIVLLGQSLMARGYSPLILTFYPGGDLGRAATAAGLSTADLSKTGRWSTIRPYLRLRRILRTHRDGTVLSYLATANIAAVMARWPARTPRLFWGIRAARDDTAHPDPLARRAARLERRLAKAADGLILNAEAARDLFAHKVPADRIHVIPNGIDTERFKPGGEMLNRPDLGDGPVIGTIGWMYPKKDHPNFLNAAALIAQRHPTAQFMIVGDGPAEAKAALLALAEKKGLSDRLILPGPTDRPEGWYRRFDVFVLSSIAEGFPNVLGEAMACGRPCVTTEAGDAAQIAGDAARVVPIRDPDALAAAVLDVLSLPKAERVEMGRKARARILEHFGVEALVTATLAIVES